MMDKKYVKKVADVEANKAVKGHEVKMHKMAHGGAVGGTKVRGTGAAIKGTRARGPMG